MFISIPSWMAHEKKTIEKNTKISSINTKSIRTNAMNESQIHICTKRRIWAAAHDIGLRNEQSYNGCI